MPELLEIDCDLLRPNPWNTNIVGPDNEAKLGRSIEELGQFKPVIARHLPCKKTKTDYEILGGEHRWQEVKARGGKILVFNLGKIDDVKAKKITLADNARYGADDTVQLAKLLEEIGTPEEIQEFLPYTDIEVQAIFATSDIALDDLELPESFDGDDRSAEPKPEKTPKTHTIMRFKVALSDAEKISELIAKTQKKQGFSGSDELTNAGDALVHLILNGTSD